MDQAETRGDITKEAWDWASARNATPDAKPSPPPSPGLPGEGVGYGQPETFHEIESNSGITCAAGAARTGSLAAQRSAQVADSRREPAGAEGDHARNRKQPGSAGDAAVGCDCAL